MELLPEAGIREHLLGLSQGRTWGWLAIDNQKLIGLMTFWLNRGLPVHGTVRQKTMQVMVVLRNWWCIAIIRTRYRHSAYGSGQGYLRRRQVPVHFCRAA